MPRLPGATAPRPENSCVASQQRKPPSLRKRCCFPGPYLDSFTTPAKPHLSTDRHLIVQAVYTLGDAQWISLLPLAPVMPHHTQRHLHHGKKVSFGGGVPPGLSHCASRIVDSAIRANRTTSRRGSLSHSLMLNRTRRCRGQEQLKAHPVLQTCGRFLVAIWKRTSLR